MDKELLERGLRELPVVQYAFLETKELTFTPRVRQVCENDCAQYGKSWACPPAVGSVEECKARCLSYPYTLLLVTMTEVEDIADLEATLATRGSHEEVTRAAAGLLREQGITPYVLSTESCAICSQCTYPVAPCRHPDRMYPCVESHGILILDTTERMGIPFQAGGNVVTWVSLLLYR